MRKVEQAHNSPTDFQNLSISSNRGIFVQPEEWDNVLRSSIVKVKNNDLKFSPDFEPFHDMYARHMAYGRMSHLPIDLESIIEPGNRKVVESIADACSRLNTEESNGQFLLKTLTCADAPGASTVILTWHGKMSLCVQTRVIGVVEHGRLYTSKGIESLYQQLIRERNDLVRKDWHEKKRCFPAGDPEYSIQSTISYIHKKCMLMGILAGETPLEINISILKDLEASSPQIKELEKSIGERNLPFVAVVASDSELIIRFLPRSVHTNTYNTNQNVSKMRKSELSFFEKLKKTIHRDTWSNKVSLTFEEFEVDHKWEATYYCTAVIRAALEDAPNLWNLLRHIEVDPDDYWFRRKA